jgi:hypothetical protein
MSIIVPDTGCASCGVTAILDAGGYCGACRVSFESDVARSCRICDCTDDEPCPGGCHWVGPDLCSSCEGGLI